MVGSDQFIAHNAGSIFSPDSNIRTFEWVAPPKGAGDIIYPSTLTIVEDSVTPTVGVASEQIGATLSAFPNPVDDLLYISLQGTPNSTDIVLVNLMGQRFLAMSLKGRSAEPDTVELPAGVYFLLANTRSLGRILIAH